jgi:nondiscriminating glutamyl-tRNA synthetase
MRLRFAPSPTGFLHIGNARTALCNHLIAKKNNATMILRVEDTDMERSSSASEESILHDLRWLGIEWNEGPDKGGKHGPYRQSERFEIYRKYTDRLLSEGKAYLCYCTQEELDAQRKQASEQNRPFIYPGTCRNLSEADRQRLGKEGRKPTVRFRVPDGETIIVNDRIRGKVIFGSENIGGDFIIVRSDGVPIYNYIVIIDDELMEVSHVIRGEDHLPNTPKQILIAQALGFPAPEYAHLPLVVGEDRTKLSKRHGITSVANYRDAGYLPEALVNYLAMLGWATESGEEILPVEEIARQIDIDRLASSAAVFDFQKLKWMNASYIRNYPLGTITDLFIPFIESAGLPLAGVERGWLEKVIGLVRGNCELLADIGGPIRMFMLDEIEPDAEASSLLAEDDSKKIIAEAHRLVQSEINEGNFAGSLVNAIKAGTSLKGKKLFMPVRAILTGSLHGPELDQALPLIGFSRCKKRIEAIFRRYCA